MIGATYDDWKLATPPEYERPDLCPGCGAQDACECEPDDNAAHDRHVDAQIDAAREG